MEKDVVVEFQPNDELSSAILSKVLARLERSKCFGTLGRGRTSPVGGQYAASPWWRNSARLNMELYIEKIRKYLGVDGIRLYSGERKTYSTQPRCDQSHYI